MTEQLNEMDVLKTAVKNKEKTRKDYAEKANETINKSVMFDYMSDRFVKENVKTYIAEKYPVDKILEWLKVIS